MQKFSALVIALLTLPAFGQALPQVFTQTVQANAIAFSGGSATAANASTITFSNAANGPIYATANQTVSLGGGSTATVAVRTAPSGIAIAKAVSTFALKVTGVLGVGIALYDLSKELGFTLERMPDGSLGVIQTTPQNILCQVSGGGCNGSYPLRSNPGESVTSFANRFSATYFGGVPFSQISGDCRNYPAGWYCFGVAQVTTQSNPSNIQALEDAIAIKSGWPVPSKIDETLNDAIRSGVPLPLPAPNQVTGPSSVPLPPTTTTWPDGSTTVRQPSKDIAYGPSGITVTDRSVNTTTSPTGVTSPTSTITSPAEPVPAPAPAAQPEKPKDPCGLPDTPLCAVDGAGAPTGETLDQDLAKRESMQGIKDFLQNPASVAPVMPTINWAFALPSLCTVVVVPGDLNQWISEIDMCQWQPMFHDIMGVIWSMGGLFGAISLFMRSSLST